MNKTITRKRNANHSAQVNYHQIEKIIKDALDTTAADNLKDRLAEIVTDSIHNAKTKSKSLSHGVSNFVHKKPYVSVGIGLTSLVLGACAVFLIKKIKD